MYYHLNEIWKQILYNFILELNSHYILNQDSFRWTKVEEQYLFDKNLSSHYKCLYCHILKNVLDSEHIMKIFCDAAERRQDREHEEMYLYNEFALSLGVVIICQTHILRSYYTQNLPFNFHWWKMSMHCMQKCILSTSSLSRPVFLTKIHDFISCRCRSRSYNGICRYMYFDSFYSNLLYKKKNKKKTLYLL